MLLPITQKPSHVSRENLETDFVNNSFSFVKEIVIMVSLHRPERKMRQTQLWLVYPITMFQVVR